MDRRGTDLDEEVVVGAAEVAVDTAAVTGSTLTLVGSKRTDVFFSCPISFLRLISLADWHYYQRTLYL